MVAILLKKDEVVIKIVDGEKLWHIDAEIEFSDEPLNCEYYMLF